MINPAFNFNFNTAQSFPLAARPAVQNFGAQGALGAQGFFPPVAQPAGFGNPQALDVVAQLLQLMVQSFGQYTGLGGGLPSFPGIGQPTLPTNPNGPIYSGGSLGSGGLPHRYLDANDYANYFLAGSLGGQTITQEQINGAYAQQGSRFATAGGNEFDAAIASAYAVQFKAYALGVDAVYNPGDNIAAMSNNLVAVQNTPFTAEAELLSKVAAVYRGELTGSVNKYDNNALRNVLLQFGRQDLAFQQGVGQTDVESIGAVVKALNEEQNPQIRRAMLQQVFDFENNTPSSPSGAVPNLGAYQRAIQLVNGGGLDQLMNNYRNGVRTFQPLYNGPASPYGDPTLVGSYGIGGGQGSQPINKNIDFTTLNDAQRSQLGLSDRDRAILHLWGRQIISTGQQDGGIYFNVLGPNGDGANWADKDEVALIQELAAREQQQFGGITGKALDQAFFDLHFRLTGEDLSQRYGNTPVRFGQGPINIQNDINNLSQITGLNRFEQGVLRFYGHEPLFTGGQINGQYLAYTLGNPNSLDGNRHSLGNAVDDVAMSLLQADLTSDGVLNGDSLATSFVSVLDKIYLGGQGTNANQVQNNALTMAQRLGRTAQQVQFSMTQGVQDAIDQVTQTVLNNPTGTFFGVSGLGMAISVCPFLGGLGAAGAASAISSGQGQAAHAQTGVQAPAGIQFPQAGGFFGFQPQFGFAQPQFGFQQPQQFGFFPFQ